MERKYYTCEQILEALSEVGVGAGDISEVMGCLGRMPSAEPNLISRLSELRSQYNCFNENERDTYHTLSEAIEVLKKRKAGYWILSFDEYENTWICSECGEEYVLYDGTIAEQHYCPNCGARMEVDMENEDDEDEDD